MNRLRQPIFRIVKHSKDSLPTPDVGAEHRQGEVVGAACGAVDETRLDEPPDHQIDATY
jgi:hypothetical protein